MLSFKIKTIFKESFKTYGAIRIHRELKASGIKCSKNRVARIMRELGLKSVHARRFKPCTTNSKHSYPVANNVINQDFSATRVNQKWGCDITYIRTHEGFLYLAIVMDFCSRRIVGWSTSSYLRSDLCIKALKKALFLRKPPDSLIHHSDRGSQYTSYAYSEILTENNFTQSMSRTGNCYDNAMVESFFSNLKVEWTDRKIYQNRNQAHWDIAFYIERFYNSKRRHSGLDYLSPNEYELYQVA